MALKTLFCGARWLGMECLARLAVSAQIELFGAVVPGPENDVWWSDVRDADFTDALGVKRVPWRVARKTRGLDLVVSVLTPCIFRAPLIDSVRYGVINLHPAPLPQYRGCNSYSHAILDGAQWYGVTMHYVDEQIDTGPIIARAPLQIKAQDTAWTLYQRAQPLAYRLFEEQLPRILHQAQHGRRMPSWPQHQEGEPAYYRRDSLADKRVDLDWPAERVARKVRALQFPPFPPAYFECAGERVELYYRGGKVCLG